MEPAAAPASSDLLLDAIAPAELADILRTAGFRAVLTSHADGTPEVHSASQGLGCFIRFGNAASAGGYFDFSFVCTIAVEGPSPRELVDGWNASRRFGRACILDDRLILSLDVSVAGGVTRAHVRSQCLLWDRLMQEFVLHLNQRQAASAASSRD